MPDKASAGQDIYDTPFGSARVQNKVLEAAEIVHRSRLGVGGIGRPSPLSSSIVTVRNGTGGALRRGEVIDLNTLPLTGTPAREYPWFVAAIPNEQRTSAILLEQIPSASDATGDAQTAGTCPALVNFSSTAHKFARVVSGQKVLQSNADSGPVRVIVAPSGTGEQMVWVSLGGTSNPGTFLAKVPLTGIPARTGLDPGTTTVDVWRLDSSGDLVDAGFTQEIHNIYPVAVAFDANVPYFQINQDNFGKWFCEAPQVAQVAVIGVPFRNDSGFTVPPGGCMAALDSVVLGGIPHVRCWRPGAGPGTSGARFDRFWLINGQTAVANGGTGLGSWLTDFVGFVALDDSVSTPGTRITWGPRPGSFGLAKDRLGFNPLASGDFTINSQRCGYFKQHVINDVFGKYYDDLEQGGTALFEIYYRNAQGKLHPAGWDKIQVFDLWAQRNERVERGTKGKAHWYCGNWEQDLTACNVSNSEEGQPSGSAGFQLNNDLALNFAAPVTPASVAPLTFNLPVRSLGTF